MYNRNDPVVLQKTREAMRVDVTQPWYRRKIVGRPAMFMKQGAWAISITIVIIIIPCMFDISIHRKQPTEFRKYVDSKREGWRNATWRM